MGLRYEPILPAFRDASAERNGGVLLFLGNTVTRVAVFIDYQNVYMRARELFGSQHGHFVDGQIYPRRLGILLTQRGRDNDSDRELEVVKVFRGEPSAKHSSVGQAACQRQVRYWSSQQRVEAITRPLHYYRSGYRNGVEQFEAREKGIDVLIALAIALGAERDEYDVCVLCSADTDLLPALEQAREAGKKVEVAAWKPDRGYASRLSLPGMWCHYLNRSDYQRVADPTDYTREVRQPPSPNP